jgi:S-adenosylmethionine-dependent methyltransferase
MASEVERYYDEFARYEWERLQRRPMEFALTMRALSRHLPPPPAAILDLGGGPGRYAIALARRGYAVTLVDLSRESLAVAEEKAAEAGVTLAGAIHGNALDLSVFPTGGFDTALVMGPLYHLVTPADQQQALRQTSRVLRDGGLVAASIIIRYATIRWAAKHQPGWLLEHREAVERLLQTGVATGDRRVSFTDAYYSRPGELPALLEETGFAVLDTVACEGLTSRIDDQITTLTGELWEAWVDLNERVCRDPSIFGAVEHLLCIGRKG